MKTKLLYLADSYQKTATASVVEVIKMGKQTHIILNQTVFYAQGGGQPPDVGLIVGKKGKLVVSHVSYNGGDVLHKGDLQGQIKKGESVELVINWDSRYHHMQLHTAGHILDQAVKNVFPKIKGVDGNHGIHDKVYVEFDKKIEQTDLPKIQKEIDNLIAHDLPVVFEMVTKQQLLNRKIHIPFDLPKNKELRIMSIGQYPPMPDGGSQLKTTGESWPIIVIEVKEKKGNFRVNYQVKNPSKSQADVKTIKDKKTQTKKVTTLKELKKEISHLQSQLPRETSTNKIDLKTKYLGKKGLFNQLAKHIRDVEAGDRKKAGLVLNQLKQELTEKINALHATRSSQQNKKEWTDLTMPGLKPKVGHMHPISQAMEEITHIFEKIGFSRSRYPEVDWDWYVFESLNMPPDHPARDEWETFFIDAPEHKKMGKMVLTTHTSNGQVREMERLKSKPPIRMINIARCYRRQQDATHTQMFHQFEGLVVDEGINLQHLKGTLDFFAEQFYGPGTKSRIRPSHFQFTEPSLEVDFSCHICKGTGKKSGQRCKFCKSGWHEVGGAGMVHPNVLKAGGIDPNKYTGFAFGWGVERTYTLKEGLNIDDIRLLYSGDLRFLEQF